ncbi:MAG: glycoside hydrolase family 9 protein [Defluviitaleaceae bacterium]|nr:glycoside hydrolase family 9 protein [Defluviitaleaceae bacterium]
MKLFKKLTVLALILAMLLASAPSALIAEAEPATQDLQLQTIYVNPAPWQGGGTTWRTEGWGGGTFVPNPSWTTLTIQCYYENGVLEFDVRHTGDGDRDFQIGLRSNRHGTPYTIYWNAEIAGVEFTATEDWQSFTLSVKDLYDAHPGTPFGLGDLWYIRVAGHPLEFRDVRISSPDDERQYPFVKVNQVGYEIGRPKPAIVSYFAKFGSLDGMNFYVINTASGETAYTGNLGTAILDPFNSDGYSWSGEMMHHIYFCGLNEPGEFFIRIPNAGLDPDARTPRDIAEGLDVETIESARFTIAENVYEELLVDLIRYFFFQRQGLDLEERYAGDFARENLHPDDVAVRLWSDRNNPDPAPYNIYDISQGWYDAGDYGKYIAPSTTTVSDLLWAYELFPNVFANLNLNIPETNPENPLFTDAPGILSELKWQLDKMLKFEHHSRDGSFFIAANYCSENNTIWIEDTLHRRSDHYSEEHERDLRSHHATANMAAVLAHAYLVYRDYDVFADFAEEMLETALRAWGWVNDPDNTKNRRIDAANRVYTFGDDELTRSMFWAAGALYRAVSASDGDTAEFSAHLYANFEDPDVVRAFSGWNSVNYNHGGMGFKGYVHYLFENNAPTPAIRDRFISPTNGFPDWRRIMETYHANEWRITYPQWGLWWGSNQMIVQNSLTMFLGSLIESQIDSQINSGEITEDVIVHMESAAHFMLGLNPISFSYVSGHGENSVMNIFSAIFSRYARLDPYRIPPGYFTEGSNIYDNRHLSRFDGKCFVDSDGEWTTNENTIYHNAALTFLMAAIIAHTVDGLEPFAPLASGEPIEAIATASAVDSPEASTADPLPPSFGAVAGIVATGLILSVAGAVAVRHFRKR